jgi:hypothetical protein
MNSSIRYRSLQKTSTSSSQCRETNEQRYPYEDAKLHTFLASALQAMAERSATTLDSLYQYHFGHHALGEICFVYISFRGYTQQTMCIKYRLFSFTICYLKSFYNFFVTERNCMKLSQSFYALGNLFFMLQHVPCDAPKYPELNANKVQKCSEPWPESLQKRLQFLLDGCLRIS